MSLVRPARQRARRRAFSLLVAIALMGSLTTGVSSAPPVRAADGDHVASGWTLIKFPEPQPLCAGVGFLGSIYYDRLDCGFGYASVSGTTVSSSVTAQIRSSAGDVLSQQATTWREEEQAWEFEIAPAADWPAGELRVRISAVDGATGNFGETTFFLNQLGATVGPEGSGHQPGDAFTATGSVFELDQVPPLAATQQKDVPAGFSLQVSRPDGSVAGPYGPFTAGTDGSFSQEIPGEATAGLTADASSNFSVTVGIEVIGASYTDTLTGDWAAGRAGAGALTLSVPPDGLVLENSFVSSVGWVKPGDAYPSRLFVKNYGSAAAADVNVSVPAVAGMSFTRATAATGSGACAISGGWVTWTIPSIPGAGDGGPGIASCVLEAKAKTTAQDPQVVWKDISTAATLNYTGPSDGATARSHGPKVIPPDASFDTARYGDRPFPVVPVDFSDRSHEVSHTGEALANQINSPGVPGSTFNLYQEMSYGQLFPHAAVPSAEIATAGWDGYAPGFQFSKLAPAGTCHGVTYADMDGAIGSPLLPERIRDGWYQLPGNTDYYGDDKFGSAIAGSVVPNGGFLLDIDSACGPTGKSVFDAAQIADPEIDYSDFDTDKDGVVDFFMMVFTGLGGNGASQLNVPPYDNIWPHSSSLEFYYSDPETGEKGYVSDDQLKDLEGRPLFWTDASRSKMTTTDTGIKVFVRIGPYNVNPESAIDKASVISHEYGHSLGLPDFYSVGGRETYGTWNLMAEDHSQNMDVFGKQELGWIVPNVLEPGQQVTASDWQDSKRNSHVIKWVDAAGNPYRLEGASVNNGEAYVAKLPGRQILDPALVETGASPTHVWWSGSGNDFGCAPQGGHNVDVYLPELASVPAGTPVTVSFKSNWNMEWDFDYGFVMASTDGAAYQSLASRNGYTTPVSENRNANTCQAQYGNGITGTSGSYAAGTETVDRLTDAYPAGGFLADSYDLSAFAGKATTLRFSYATDPGVAHTGWFIDDLRVTAGEQVIYDSDFESGADEARIFNGGCSAGGSVAQQCTAGWQYVDSSAESPADHAYYLEMRDRSSFDLDGKGEDDRANGPSFAGGLLLVYTDEAHGYGNVGTDDPPAQSPLDSQPEPGNDTPNLDDAAFTAASGDSDFSDAGEGWTDNYADASSADGNWHLAFDCLSFDVNAMSGNGNGPGNVPPYDLSGTVSFTTGDGCAAFDYGYGAEVANAAPTAIAEARPTEVAVGDEVAFDGSGSFDDRQAPSELEYAWDFDGDGAFDGSGQSTTHAYDTAGTYHAVLKVTDADGASGTDTVTITVSGAPDLEIGNLTTTTKTGEGGANGKPRQGDKVTVTATVTNSGTETASASTTSFAFDGDTSLGTAATPELAPGASADVSVEWDTRQVKGQHTLSAQADSKKAVDESNEDNNGGELTVTVRGNKVENGSFEQPNDAGSGPAAWSASDTKAGTAEWSDQGTDGDHAASFAGSGGNALLAGSPTWTSDPIDVSPGETLSLRLSVLSDHASSAPSAALAYLGTAGRLLKTVSVISIPKLTGGFEVLEKTVELPPGVLQVRVVLTGFAPTDLKTAGTVIFDEIGLYGP